MNKVWNLTNEFRTMQDRYNGKVNLLAKKYLHEFCAFKIGDTITIKDSPDGFTIFKIAKIVPDINWENQKIRLKAYGVMSGFEKEDTEKMIYLDDLKKAVPGDKFEKPQSL